MGFPSSSISPINFMHRPNKELLSVAVLQQSHPTHTCCKLDLYASLKGHVTLPTRCRALKLEPRGGEAHRYPPVAKATPTEKKQDMPVAHQQTTEPFPDIFPCLYFAVVALIILTPF